MVAHRYVWLVVLGAFSSLGASARTQNFAVEAQTAEIAQQVGQYAEMYRKQKAIQWLGQEMPAWGSPCPLRVTVTPAGAGGATSFGFDRGRILTMEMHIEGPLDRLLASVLPHEVTHTVLAYYFRTPVPRWADEGSSVLSEDDEERDRHDRLVRQKLNSGRAMPLRRLFALTEYPADVMVLYAEGFSVTSYLVGLSSRPQFLAFVAQGMRGDWDAAVKAHYRFNSVEELEKAWLQHLRNTKQQRPEILASTPQGSGDSRVVVRQTAPPVQPLADQPQPIVRSQAPEEPAPYGFLPEYQRVPLTPTARVASPSLPPPPSCPGGICPVSAPGQVSLGAPQFGQAPPVQLGQPTYYAQPVPAGPGQ